MVQGTSGLQFSICDEDYDRIMADMGLAVGGQMTSFRLSYAAVDDSIEVSVDEELIAEDPVLGWTYNAEAWTVDFHGDYVPPKGSTVSITYLVASGSGDEPEEVGE